MWFLSYCYITARAVDTAPPRIFNCPNDITVTTETGQYSAVVRWQEPTAIDNSDEPITTLRTHFPGNRFPLGTISVEYTFTDSSGNEAACTFEVTVVCKYFIENESEKLVGEHFLNQIVKIAKFTKQIKCQLTVYLWYKST